MPKIRVNETVIKIKAGLGYPSIPTLNAVDFDISADSDFKIGRMRWNDTDKCVEYDTVNGSTIQIGQEVVLKVLNKTGSTIVNGKPVYVNGVQGQRPTIALADADSEVTSHTVMGLTTHAIPNNQEGLITVIGQARDMDCSGTPYGEVWAEGDCIYLSAGDPGDLTKTRPATPNHGVRIGLVLNNSAGTGGVMCVSVHVGEDFGDLHGVDISGATAGQALIKQADGTWAGGPAGSVPNLTDVGDVIILSPTENGFLGYRSGVHGHYNNYDDIQVQFSTAKVPPSNAPTWRDYDYGTGGITYPVQGFALGNYLYYRAQTTHSTKLNTTLESHIHWTIPSNSVGDKIKFQMDVVAAPIGGTFAVVSGSPYTVEYTLDGTESNKHNYLDIDSIASVNTTVSTIYLIKFSRIAASSNDYANEVYIDYNDSHILIDTPGSRTEHAK